MPLKWNGAAIAARARAASVLAVDKTMSECVDHGKHNHPWQNETGTAEGSIRIVDFAKPKGEIVAGQWGSSTVRYFIFLELGTSRMPAMPTLRPAADVVYPRLRAYIAAYFAGMGK